MVIPRGLNSSECNRKQVNLYVIIRGELWPEYKIWQIASLLIDRCSTLEKISLNHSDLRPKNIFINNDQIIFAEPTAIPGIGSAYKKAMDGD